MKNKTKKVQNKISDAVFATINGYNSDIVEDLLYQYETGDGDWSATLDSLTQDTKKRDLILIELGEYERECDQLPEDWEEKDAKLIKFYGSKIKNILNS